MQTLGIIVALLGVNGCDGEPGCGAAGAASAALDRGPRWPEGCVARAEDLPPARAESEAERRRLLRDRVVVASKADRRLMLFDRGELQACWSIGLGSSPSGHKQVEGDRRTPQGWYRLSDKPWSSFDGAIAVHYPAARDAAEARRAGRISAQQRQRIERADRAGELPPQRTPLGGEILIHGGGGSSDWTWGCIALDDDDLDDLRARLSSGMRGHIAILD